MVLQLEEGIEGHYARSFSRPRPGASYAHIVRTPLPSCGGTESRGARHISFKATLLTTHWHR